MTFNPSYAELLGKEMQMQRMREAKRERLIRQVSGWKPSSAKKLFIIVRSRWSNYWSRVIRKKGNIPISRIPKNSPSL